MVEMTSMTDTAGTDDQQSDNVTDNGSSPPYLPAEGRTKMNGKKDGHAGQHDDQVKKPWPVDRRNHTSLRKTLHDLYISLSYSYMNPIFEKGMNQFKSGEHLDLEDLFGVPENMSSAFLVEKFW